jgi:hypothetical protein
MSRQGAHPSHGLNDKKMVEMAAFEECGLLSREMGHAGDYPQLLEQLSDQRTDLFFVAERRLSLGRRFNAG